MLRLRSLCYTVSPSPASLCPSSGWFLSVMGAVILALLFITLPGKETVTFQLLSHVLVFVPHYLWVWSAVEIRDPICPRVTHPLRPNSSQDSGSSQCHAEHFPVLHAGGPCASGYVSCFLSPCVFLRSLPLPKKASIEIIPIFFSGQMLLPP